MPAAALCGRSGQSDQRPPRHRGPAGRRRGRRGPAGPGAQCAAARKPAAAAAGAKARSNQLVCLHVRYQGYITGYVAGDLHHHEVTFHEQVRGAYAPVDSWTASIDTDSPETLGPDGAVLHCDQLSVVNMTPPHSKDAAARDMEFVAAGNAVAEGGGDVFTARAARITYDQKKQLMILEGDGRTDAELYRQQTPGGAVSKAAAQKIWYWQATNSSYIDGARSLDFDQTPGDTVANRGRSRSPPIRPPRASKRAAQRRGTRRGYSPPGPKRHAN